MMTSNLRSSSTQVPLQNSVEVALLSPPQGSRLMRNQSHCPGVGSPMMVKVGGDLMAGGNTHHSLQHEAREVPAARPSNLSLVPAYLPSLYPSWLSKLLAIL